MYIVLDDKKKGEKSRMKLSRQIALYVGIIVLIICLGLGLTSYKFSSDTLVEEAEKSLVLLAKAGISNLEAVIQGNIGVLEGCQQESSTDYELGR